MPDYDTMSVHDLVLLASHDGAMQQHFKRNIPSVLSEIESAIRKAVIREAALETAKKPKKRAKKKTVGGTGMTADEFYHWQHDSYPN
jgi:Mor family transcriptional regulator